MLWFAVAATAISYGSSTLIGSVVEAKESQVSRPVEIVDFLKPGVHQLSGMVFVPKDCDQLRVRVVKNGERDFLLVFQTWEAPSVPCREKMVPRSFTATAFGPAAGVHFTATLDDIPLPIVVIPKIQDAEHASR
ncbi:MAG: hypothetical protein RIQ56_523 [Candidatus Parcubacteria bacterium]